MAEPFISEIRIFAGNFAPKSFAFCDGQLLSIVQNQALFSLIGTTYGGDGQTTFALPDLRGRLPIHRGQGPGLSPRTQGESGGAETETLTVDQMPSHHHSMQASATVADQTTPQGNVLGFEDNFDIYNADASDLGAFRNDALLPAGGGQPHTNMMPYICVNFIIALFGVFPSRN